MRTVRWPSKRFAAGASRAPTPVARGRGRSFVDEVGFDRALDDGVAVGIDGGDESTARSWPCICPSSLGSSVSHGEAAHRTLAAASPTPS